MKRIIKFRAWIKLCNQMFYPKVFIFDNGYIIFDDSLRLLRTYCFMQFTGLHDKKRNEIYEGDVVKVDNDPYVITVCKWHNGSFILEDNAGGHWTRQLLHQRDRLEVIGNIYQHKHLLK